MTSSRETFLIYKKNSNSVAQQSMRARAYCALPSIRDHWALRCMSRCPDQVISLKREPNVFKSPSKLGTHLSTHCSTDERLSRPCPAQKLEPAPVVWKHDTLPLDHWAYILRDVQ
ncbi:uncharacterized protein TNCV_5013101 [Trichonephila clavipes]|nr:uncharacterized protein TNCV_5013101 [Trichonephila clavipes]